MKNEVSKGYMKTFMQKVSREWNTLVFSLVILFFINSINLLVYTAVATKVVPQKAYATMPIGIMGRKSLVLID